MKPPARLIQLGVFGAPQGVKGEVRLKSFTQNPGDVVAYGALVDKSGARSFAVKIVRPLRGDMVIAQVEGVSTRDGAAALTHVGLYVRRDQLPPPEMGEYYQDDLIGLAARLADGTPFGAIVAVLSYGAGDILEIAPSEGGETLLLPFNDTTFPDIDFSGGVITIVPPAIVDGERG